MGLFDKLKENIGNAMETAKEGYGEAVQMSIEELLDKMKDLGALDPKMLVLQSALQEKLDDYTPEGLDELYKAIKKQGGLLKKHPAQKFIENYLVDKRLYTRQEDGTLTKNSKLDLSFLKKFKKGE